MRYLCYKVVLSAVFLFSVHLLVAQGITRGQYINTYKDIAIRQMNAYGIPASIILAQACLESGNGNSRLAVKGNNHFGIKCHNTWKGKRIYHNDDSRGECFRRYSNAEDSFKDHSEFLKNSRRYQSLFDLKKTDYKAWAHGLKAAGYATNPKYAQMLIDIIEKNELHKYDTPWAYQEVKYSDKQAEKARKKALRQERKAERQRKKEEKRAARAALKAGAIAAVPVAAGAAAGTAGSAAGKIAGVIPEGAGGPAPLQSSNLYRYSMDRQIYQENGTPYIITTDGDTYAAIAKEYNLFLGELLSFNDLEHEPLPQSGTMVYIGRKKKSCAERTYTVADGETMYIISQKKGIRLKSLYDLNQMKYGTEPESGKIINLRK